MQQFYWFLGYQLLPGGFVILDIDLFGYGGR